MTTAASDPEIVPRPSASMPALRAADQGVADALQSVLSNNTRRVYAAQRSHVTPTTGRYDANSSSSTAPRIGANGQVTAGGLPWPPAASLARELYQLLVEAGQIASPEVQLAIPRSAYEYVA